MQGFFRSKTFFVFQNKKLKFLAFAWKPCKISTHSNNFCFHFFYPSLRIFQTETVPILKVELLFWMQLWPVAHFFHPLLGGCNSKANPFKSEWKKWATVQSCIRKRSTTCKIGTLETSAFYLEKQKSFVPKKCVDLTFTYEI